MPRTFSLKYAVLLRPLPYHEPERLVMIWTKQEKLGVEQTLVSEHEVLDFREQAKLFEGFAVLNGKTQALEDDINEATVQVMNLIVNNRQKVNLAGAGAAAE